MSKSEQFFLRLVIISLLCILFFPPQTAYTASLALPCELPGWFPEDHGVKDHTIFRYDDYYYIAANYIPYEKKFAYARSTDLCLWEELDPILDERLAGTWDELAIWSPNVFEEEGIYYMYFTGVTRDFTQSILLATSSNPDDPQSWEIQDMVFQPDHPGSTWIEIDWADCRDPMVMKLNGVYYLYYTGYDELGGIVGVATSDSPTGEWTDWGNIIPPLPGNLPESPTLYFHQPYYYLFYHPSGQSETYRIGASPSGPWTEPHTIAPGWAHEVWDGVDGITYTSYLTDYSISISPITWNTYYSPPRPFIGEKIYLSILPLIIR